MQNTFVNTKRMKSLINESKSQRDAFSFNQEEEAPEGIEVKKEIVLDSPLESKKAKNFKEAQKIEREREANKPGGEVDQELEVLRERLKLMLGATGKLENESLNERVHTKNKKTFRKSRAKKCEEEKVKKITIYLEPKNVEYLELLPFGRGPSTKIKEIIKDYKNFKRREYERLSPIIGRLKFISEVLEDYDRTALNEEKVKKIKEVLDNQRNEVIKGLGLLKYRPGEIKEYFSEEEWGNISLIL